MAAKPCILFLSEVFLAAVMTSLLSGCGGTTANVQNPPPPAQNNVSVAFQPEPAASVAVGLSETLTAVVTNDPTNSGVSWSLTCAIDPGNKMGLCGSLIPPQSGAGTNTGSTTYTAPATLSTSSLDIQIVAFSTKEPTANVVASITVNTFDAMLPAGNYVFQLQGDQSGIPYQLAGVITFDGQGNVIAGEQTLNSNGTSVTDSILRTGSSYFIGSDSRGTITLNDQTIGTEIFTLVFLNSSQNPKALLSQTGVDNTGAQATGTLDAQTSSLVAPTGSYAFVMSGYDVLDGSQTGEPLPLAFGGVFNISSGQTAISGVIDEVISGALKLNDSAFAAGSQLSSGPDKFGQVTFTLVGLLGASHPKAITAVLTGYIVDATHIKLIESDESAGGTIPGFATTGGLSIAQAAGSYGNFTNASFSGTYVSGIIGIDLSKQNIPPNGSFTPWTWTTADVLTADGNGNLTSGYTDTFLQLNCEQLSCAKPPNIPGGQISSSLTGTYSVDSGGTDPGSGTGRTTMNDFTFSSYPNPADPAYSPNLFFYLTGNASGPAALVLATGDLPPQPKLHYPSIGTGVAYAQTSASALSGSYGTRFTQQGSFGENEGTAQFNANASAALPVSGIGDSVQAPPTDTSPSDHAFSGTFGTPQPDTVFTGTVANYNSFGTGNDGIVFLVGNNGGAPNDTGNFFTVDYYPVDQDLGFWIETDLITGIAGNPAGSGQVSLGQYGARTPVCSGCP